MDPGLDSLFGRLSAAATHQGIPPVDRWHPQRAGDSHMRIAADGRWYFHGSEIQRPAMVRLFSSVLRRDAHGYVLVTPVEKLDIEVDDAPFVTVDFEVRGIGNSAEIAFETNVGDIVVADSAHRIEVHRSPQGPRPYVDVRGGLRALIARSNYYALVGLATERDGHWGVMSRGAFFALDPG